MALIKINGIEIDPVQSAPMIASANLLAADSSASNYLLIQTKGPLSEAQKAEVKGLGAEILEYVPIDTYIARYLPSDLNRIRALPYVVWANTFMKGFKVNQHLRSAAQKPATSVDLLNVRAPDEIPSDGSVTVDVVLQKGAPPDMVRNEIATAAGLSPNTLLLGRNRVRMTVQRDRLNALADIDDVRHIEPYIAPQLLNNISREVLRVDVAQQGNQMQGDEQVIVVCDTGFDLGSVANAPPPFAGRVRNIYAIGRPGDASDPNGHGTHVAGSALGDGTSQILNIQIQGTAPKAQLVVQSILNSDGGLQIDSNLQNLFDTPYRNDGARVHTNSWGAPVGGRYSANDTDVDDFVWNNRDMVICFAAGNSGSDSTGKGRIDQGSITSPGCAKNCITVGACENDRQNFPNPSNTSSPLCYSSFGFSAAPFNTDQVANNPEGMVAFSSRGPVTNNRVKPDVLAPGSAVLSTKSRASADNGWGASLDPAFFFDGGTSMATPQVAGCAAVVRQFLQSKQIVDPSAALVKAMLINGAKPISGQYTPAEIGQPPDNSQGFGRVDLAATIGPYAAGETVTFFDEANALSTDAESHAAIDIAADGRTLKVTLVWTDMPGEALQNDLDLIIRASNGSEQHGNRPMGAQDFDRTNNVEQISWPNIPSGKLDITVRAYRTISPQTYALVARVT